jgi:putative NADH-flavin reductase
MKITVFGSSGKVGHQVLHQALERGYSVTAYARNPWKIVIRHTALSIVKGTLKDLAEMKKAVKGSDCVISVLGPGGKPGDETLGRGMKNIIAAMEKTKVKRMIQLATPSVTDPDDGKDFLFGLMVFLIRIFVNGAYNAIISMGEIVRASGLDWTLVRVPLLTDKPLTKHVRIGYPGHKEVGIFLSRPDLAWFMLELSGKKDHIRRSPVVSN